MTPPDVPLRLSRLLHPLTVLGPGVRAGIWTQGCSIRCPGCMSRDTWGSRGGRASTVAEVLDWVESLPKDQLDGVTVSGGEPSEQPAALQGLLTGLRTRLQPGCDILVFTGREVPWTLGEGRPLFDGADAVMVGPYENDRAGSSVLRGSDNQVLLPLTDLGRDRYRAGAIPDTRAQLQLIVDGSTMGLIGIPLPGVLDRFGRDAAESGLVLRGRSWR